jgi:hypothetical protein
MNWSLPGEAVTPAMVEALPPRTSWQPRWHRRVMDPAVRTDRFTVLEGNLQNAMNYLLGITIQRLPRS